MAEGQSITVSEVEYRDIEGYPGYRVGDDGSVWSRWRQVRRPGQRAGFTKVMVDDWQRLGGSLRKKGYVFVTLFRDGKPPTQHAVHRLVLEAFVGPCPPGMETRHDPDPTRNNNRLTNLKWGTKKENGRDRVNHGTACRGRRYPKAVLSEEIVREVRRRIAAGERQCDIAAHMKLLRCQVSHIHTKRAWAWVV